MPRRASTPDRRAADAKKEVTRIRRKYKVDLTKKRKLLPGELPHVQDMVVVLRLAGYSQIQCAKVIGISRHQVAEILNEPNVQEKLVLLRERLPQAALELLENYMIEAIQAIVDIMRTSNEDRWVLQAAGEILDRAGIPKASRQERHQINEDRTVFTDDGIVDRLREAPVEVQEQAAQMIESLEGLLVQYADTASEESGESA